MSLRRRSAARLFNYLVLPLALCLPLALPARAAGLLVRGATLLHPDLLDAPAPERWLLLRDGEVVATGTGAPEMADVTPVDAHGLYLLPGLADMHVHAWDEAELPAYLAHGVTLVRNLSGMPFHLRLAERIDAGALPAPRLLTSGPILNSAGPNAQLNHQLVEDAAGARAAVQAQYDAGYRRVKVYSNLRREAYEAILDRARALGMVVAGHSPEGFRAPGVPATRPFAIAFEEILDDGFETIEHVESIAWHGLRGRHDPAAARDLAARIASAGVAVTPTLLAHHNLYRVAKHGQAFLRRRGTEWHNPVVQKLEREAHEHWLSRDPDSLAADDRFYATLTRMLDDAGVFMVAGSDAGIFSNVPGESLLEELELLNRAGLSPERVLQMATRNPARLLRAADHACIEPGCRADFVLYRCNPVRDLRCLRRPEAVIRAGTWFDRESLDALLLVAAAHEPERTWRNLKQGMAAQGTDLSPLLPTLMPP